jgi:hypothetical protein
LEKKTLPADYELYMEAEVTFPHPIPAGGTVMMTLFDSINGSAMNGAGCYVVSYIHKSIWSAATST